MDEGLKAAVGPARRRVRQVCKRHKRRHQTLTCGCGSYSVGTSGMHAAQQLESITLQHGD